MSGDGERPAVHWRRFGTGKLGSLFVLAALAAFAGLVAGRPELVVAAVPLAVALAAGIAGTQPPVVSASLRTETARCVEGDELAVTVVLEASEALDELELGLALPAALTVVDGSAHTVVSLRGGERREVELRVRVERWGAHTLGPLALRAHGPGRLVSFEDVRDLRPALKAFPRTERLVAAVVPFDTQLFAGDHRSRSVGDGIEFARVRPYSRGDPVRRVNWRITSRRGEIHVNDHHLERNADVVLFLDTFADVGPVGRSTLDLTIRGAASVARYELHRRDRVGLVGFGGTVSWLATGMGQSQLLRILDALLDVSIALSYAWKDVDVLPRRALPPRASFIAFSPLLDPRAIAALLDIRARGYALTVVDTLDEASVPPARRPDAVVAHRLWSFEREELRWRLRRLGVPLVRWTLDEELGSALARLPAGAARRAQKARA